jgi:predicted MPP superfamily phosphohydrolase
VDSVPLVMVPLLEHLRKLEAAHGVFAVMGNHDGWNIDGAMVRELFEKVGISFLINRHSLLSIGGDPLAIAGTDFIWRGKPDPVRTLKGIAPGIPVLAMVHEPDYFDVMAAQRNILLQVSGHTHGGQCRVPLAGYAPITVKYGRNYNYGEYTRGDSKLFVTRGVGTTGPRVRFACPPELAVLTLRAEKAG